MVVGRVCALLFALHVENCLTVLPDDEGKRKRNGGRWSAGSCTEGWAGLKQITYELKAAAAVRSEFCWPLPLVYVAPPVTRQPLSPTLHPLPLLAIIL